MIFFDHLIEEKDQNLFLLKFSDILDKVKYIRFSESYLEIQDLIIFSDRNETIRQFLNPNIDVFSISTEDLKKMTSQIEEKENNFIISTFLKPSGYIAFNLFKIRQDLIFYKEGKYSIIVDDMLFTVDSLEFHGSFFGGKTKIFLVTKEELKTLKTFFRKSIS